MKNFKTESKRVLDLMINSIYTNKEIFLREIISNASDAIDKLYYKSLSENIGLNRSEFEIKIKADKESKILTISDNGIGMSEETIKNIFKPYSRGNVENIADELADVEITLAQIKQIYNIHTMVEEHKDFKLKRLSAAMEKIRAEQK